MLQFHYQELQHDDTLGGFFQLGDDATQSVLSFPFAEFAFNGIGVFGVLPLDQSFGLQHTGFGLRSPPFGSTEPDAAGFTVA